MLPEAAAGLVDHSAAPAAVTVALERAAEAHPGLPDRLAGTPGLAAALVAVLGASRSLTQVVMTDGGALDVLGDLDAARPPPEGGIEDVRRWKQLELLRIAARDLLGQDRLEATGEALSAMAATVLDGACRIAGVAGGMAVVAMGKFGGRELNYASDVDVLFVGGSERHARAVMDLARRCFRVDADLRPEGRDGPLTRSVESYEAYWDRWAQPWEFQALLKARPGAGDPAVTDAFCAAASERVWERPFSADDIRSLRALKARAEGEITRKGLGDREIKRAPGGIRDIEFSIQLLQLVHGRHDPGLRSPTTLDALAELSGAGYVDPEDAGALEDAYRFLRAAEHRLQLVDEQQVYALPTDAAALDRLARTMGYRDRPDGSAVEQLDGALRRHRAVVRSIHERLYFRPLLEAFAGVEARLSPAAAEERLAAFGFADAARTRQALTELTRGLTRSSRLMQQMLPILLGWLSEAPDPDLGLLGLRTLASGPQRATELVTAFRESPEVARRLCLLLGTSRLLGDRLYHNPDLVPDLADPVALEARPAAAVLDAARDATGWREGIEAQSLALQRLKRREELRVAARDVLDGAEVTATGAALSGLAEAVVQAALDLVAPPVPFAVMAMGRFGGGELSYASDLDVLFVYDGATAEDFAAAEDAASRLLQLVNGPTPALRIYELDAKLRPEGKQGPLARSLDGYRTYYERWAGTWELQALVRARPVAGDEGVGGRFMDLIEPFVWARPFPVERVREIRRMKARVERERIPAGEDPQFHLKLGRGSLSDVEWTVQLLQLCEGVRGPGTMEALDALAGAGAVDGDDARVLAAAYRFCERARNRLFLVKGLEADALPSQPEQLTRLARSLDTSGQELREDYRRATRRARQVVERLFYGRDD